LKPLSSRPAATARSLASCLLAAGVLWTLAPRPSRAQEVPDGAPGASEDPVPSEAAAQSQEESLDSGVDGEEEEFADWGDEEDEGFTDWGDEGDDGFTDWGDEEDEAESPSLRHELTLESRTTDVFDEDPDPPAGPPPAGLYSLADEIAISPNQLFKVECEYLRYDGADVEDRGSLRVLYEPTLRSGTYLDFDAARLWDESGRTGFSAGVAVGWQAGPNLDLYFRGGGSSSVTGNLGGGVSGTIEAALGRLTALQVRGSYYRDEYGGTSSRGQLELAQHLGRRTGMHLLLRSSSSEIVDIGFEDTNSTVASVDLRHMFAENTLVRGAYRWYSDTGGVTANGVSLGVVQGFARGSLAAYYRHYWSNEEVTAGTWWITATLLF
jgi:hypothetical protein